MGRKPINAEPKTAEEELLKQLHLIKNHVRYLTFFNSFTDVKFAERFFMIKAAVKKYDDMEKMLANTKEVKEE